MADQQDLHPGELLGDYRIIRRLGNGTFGTVYLAEHRYQPEQVAIKVLHTSLTDPEDFRSFLNEARIIRLHHPHIISILDFGIDRKHLPYLVMEYASGGTLRERHPQGKPLLPDTILTYTHQFASALQFAHDQRLIHRDIKPENMLLRGDGTVLLSDFGIAKIMEHSSLASSTSMIGTPAYMAPEQGQGHPLTASDQYALAVVIYEWITGKRPFLGTPLEVAIQHRLDAPPSLTSLVPNLPPAVEQVVLKALAKDPATRFPSIQEFENALRKATTSLAPTRKSIPGAPPPTLLPTQAALSEAQEEPALPRVQAEPALPPVALASFSVFPQNTLPITSPQAETQPPSRPPRKRRTWRSALLVSVILLLISSILYGVFVENPSLLRAQNQHNATATALAEEQHMVYLATMAYDVAANKDGIQFGFNPAHTRYNPHERQISPANVSELQQFWTAQTGDSISSSPTVANHMVYVGSNDHKFYAFPAIGCGPATCDPLWTAQTGGEVAASPAFANGKVYVGSDKLYAFSATACGKATCDPLWTGQLGKGMSDSLAVANGVVYAGAYDSKLYAFNANGCGQATCHPLWTAQMGGGGTVSSPAIDSGVVYVAALDHNLYAFNANGCGQATCAPLWTAPLNGQFVNYISSPAVAAGVVYVGSLDRNLYAFKADGCGQATCAPLWTAKADQPISSSPAVANGVVYVGSYDKKLYAFKADGCGQATCDPLWTATTSNSVFASPTVANGVVYVGSVDSKLYAFNASGCGKTSCDPLWTTGTGEAGKGRFDFSSSPAVAYGIVYVGAQDGKLYAFKAS
ncbi:MAG TPA: PQQ-binding-like beta-propeller repeat protein [Ktedonobacteraceae bacterium]